MVANKNLIKSRNIDEDSEIQINLLHEARIIYEKDMEYNDFRSEKFQIALANWRKAQAKLQKLWGFDVNPSKWREYTLPKCTCPIMDNADMGEHLYISSNCPLHGDNPSAKNKKELYTKDEVYEILADNYLKYDDLDEYWNAIGEVFE